MERDRCRVPILKFSALLVLLISIRVETFCLGLRLKNIRTLLRPPFYLIAIQLFKHFSRAFEVMEGHQTLLDDIKTL
jgi:hypothetical protein